MSSVACQTCRLSLAARAVAEPCPEERCAFWEDGGSALDGECVIERLGVDISRPDLAAYLFGLRDQLQKARDLRGEQDSAERARTANRARALNRTAEDQY